ncbi:hypothetical protein NLJ89_g2215 [Agrocybe chaxingu]|uniref:CID domain-containing protein n=1 Tax=Agrocybe chaxingu TaxID=84603 RepID=A0A9W8KCI0_9AGAR|nr:hypothetical protein NLJ89_g2215 [Agrocybe chaxingu]
MASLEASPPEFETILKEVVNAKRLSASKMTQLTDLAMKNMDNDTQLVSILYRTHKSLSTTTSKISSLYIFDALSRAAKHHSSKYGITGDIYTHPGNSATFLLKITGVVEGLFQDMVASALEPKAIATDPRINSSTTQTPSQSSSIPPSGPNHSPPVPVASLDAQAALLALLTQAAGNTLVPQIAAAAIGAPASQLDAAQLAVIQQLAHTAASVPSVSQSLPLAEPVNVQKFPSSSDVNGSSRSPPSFRDEPPKMARSDQSHSGYRSPETDIRPNPHVDERDNARGRYRDGFRSRGRGDRFGRNWDDRDRDRYRNSEKNASPLRGRGGRSRSRSPPSRYGDRRGPRFDSPRRLQNASPPSWQPDTSASRPLEQGKDEFGRDIRPESPKSPVTNHQSPPPPFPISPVQPKPTPSVDPRLPPTLTQSPMHDSETDDNSVSPLITANTSSDTSSAAAGAQPPFAEQGMDGFNLAAFDYTSPASWEALGKRWQVTHGYLPSTEQLMQEEGWEEEEFSEVEVEVEEGTNTAVPEISRKGLESMEAVLMPLTLLCSAEARKKTLGRI